MFEKLAISNYQSHKETSIEFSPGINAIVGPSDNGKSAILHALLWLIQNKPDGLGFVSHWNLTPKGIIKGNTSVKLDFDKGHSITRSRTKSTNEYQVDGRKLEAVGRDIPPDVVNLLDVNDINIQSQFDSHFLLSSSAGEVARIFNKTIRLDSIDILLASAEKLKRATKSSIESEKMELDQLQNDLDKLSFLDDSASLIKKAKGMQSEIEKLISNKEELERSVEDYKEARDFVDSLPIDLVEDLIGKAESFFSHISKAEETIGKLDNLLKEYHTFNNSIRSIPDFKDVESDIYDVCELMPAVRSSLEKVQILTSTLNYYNRSKSDYEKIQDFKEVEENIQLYLESIQVLHNSVQDRTSIESSFASYQEAQKTLGQIDTEIVKLEDSLPDVCPVCGKPMDKHEE